LTPDDCPECGAPIRGEHTHCNNCGEPLRPERPLFLSGNPGLPAGTKELFIIATVLGVVSIILLGIAFVSDWYGFELESNTDKIVLFEDLGGWEIQNGTDTVTGGWNGTVETGKLYEEIRPVFLASITLVIVGTILCAFAPFAGSPRKAGYIAMSLLLVAGLLALGSALYFMNEHPGTYADDERFGELRENAGPWDSFSGQNGTDTPRSSWGPRNGWFTTLFSGVMSMGSAILCLGALVVSSPRMTGAKASKRIPDRVLEARLDDEPAEEEVRMPVPDVPDTGPARYGTARGAPPAGWSPGTTGPGEEEVPGEFDDFPVYESGRRKEPDGRHGMGYDDGPHPEVYRRPFDDRFGDDDPFGDGLDGSYMPPDDDRYGGFDDDLPSPDDARSEEGPKRPPRNESGGMDTENGHDEWS